jgi:hypothetical protein
MPRTKPGDVGKLAIQDAPLGGSRVDAAAYAASLLGELAKLMYWYRLTTLAYFIDMAHLAAEETLHDARATATVPSRSHPESAA